MEMRPEDVSYGKAEVVLGLSPVVVFFTQLTFFSNYGISG